MKKNFQYIFLFCASVIFCVLLFEFTARFFIKPSPECYGILFNHIELPPFTLKITPREHAYSDKPADNMIVDGKKITNGDLLGIFHPDIAGYAPKENAVSRNGWWQSNNLGARSPTDIAKSIPLGKQRVIIFGESFTDCVAVPGNETWPFFLNNKSKNVEFLNFGVGGYDMGQCLLRYETIRKKVDYDIAMLVFVPGADLPREINVLRQIQGWPNASFMPRFIVEDNQLKLIKSPYKAYDDFYRENKNQFSVRLKEHLRAYDRLYFSLKYESPPFWGESILYKLLARLVYTYQNKTLWRDIMMPKSEAMAISLKIFEKMNEGVKHDGKKFVLVVLPESGGLSRYNKDHKFQQHRDEMVSSIEKEGIICIDLMKDLSAMSPEQLDRAYDGVHYGPKANKIIAEILWRKLKDLKLLY